MERVSKAVASCPCSSCILADFIAVVNARSWLRFNLSSIDISGTAPTAAGSGNPERPSFVTRFSLPDDAMVGLVAGTLGDGDGDTVDGEVTTPAGPAGTTMLDCGAVDIDCSLEIGTD